ncbi:MAG: hypothetical protein HY047_13555 [Acidobacteria bacterium]|nr:hypothetical protein [Acidobacteriota bacterium]
MTSERPSALVRFYSGVGVDHRGRTLDEILAWDDDRLERVHDFVQWLFPLDEPSSVNPLAPIVTVRDREAFASHPLLRGRLIESFTRMLAFYGFRLEEYAALQVVKSAGWHSRSTCWLESGNHNYLRITRILKSLQLLGAAAHSRAFYRALVPVYETHRSLIGSRTFEYWTRAAA